MVKRIFVIMLALASLLSFAVKTEKAEAQTSLTVTQTSPTVNSCSVVEGTVTFSSDSLGHYKTNAINILPYCDYLATVSWKVTGTNPVFRINTYLSNFTSTDTTYWNLSQSWDTTGVYTAKPVNDTVTIKWNGIPMRYLYATIKGLANNREDVKVYFRVVLYRKP